MNKLTEEQKERLHEKLSQLPLDGWTRHQHKSHGIETKTENGQRVLIDKVGDHFAVYIDITEFVVMESLHIARLRKLYDTLDAHLHQKDLRKTRSTIDTFLK